jgi:hypothetical protein
VTPRQLVVAIMSGADRRGAWTPPQELAAVAIMGGIDLDFRNARFPPGGVTVHVFALWGGVDLIVPRGVRVRCSGTGIMGAFYDHSEGGGDGPELRVGGLALMGGVDIKTARPKTEREAQRALRAAERMARREARRRRREDSDERS